MHQNFTKLQSCGAVFPNRDISGCRGIRAGQCHSCPSVHTARMMMAQNIVVGVQTSFRQWGCASEKYVEVTKIFA